VYYKSKVDPAAGEMAEGYVALQGSKVSLQKINKSKCGLTIVQVRLGVICGGTCIHNHMHTETGFV
jgi:hypothetical protein